MAGGGLDGNEADAGEGVAFDFAALLAAAVEMVGGGGAGAGGATPFAGVGTAGAVDSVATFGDIFVNRVLRSMLLKRDGVFGTPFAALFGPLPTTGPTLPLLEDRCGVACSTTDPEDTIAWGALVAMEVMVARAAASTSGFWS
jgi:hypothetical protein